MMKTRREALKLLGFSSFIAYSVPTVTRLDSAKAAFQVPVPEDRVVQEMVVKLGNLMVQMADIVISLENLIKDIKEK